MNLKLPVGISDFQKIRQNGYYYIDKTKLIKEILEKSMAEVTLITRPRRFGKTIGMSMLSYFFDIRRNSQEMFKGLEISKDQNFCDRWMNQYPTLFISFKDVDGLDFRSAMDMLRNQLAWICNEHEYLVKSDKVNEYDKQIFMKLQDRGQERISDDIIKISIITIMRMMKAYYGKPVILLLDEYDVPLAKASSNGYYKEMLDVMNYIRDLQINPKAKPASYWKNTSDNAIIRSFIDQFGNAIQKKLELLLSGENITQQIEEDLTYDYLHSSEKNFWSILYLTGYLTREKEESQNGVLTLKIPNKEIKEIYETTVKSWFEDHAKTMDRRELFEAVWNGKEEVLTKEVSKLLRMTISYHDYREDFYHAFLAGIFTGAGYLIESNKEHGEGRSDIVIFNEYEGKVAIFEIKYSQTVSKLKEDSSKAIWQIADRMYAKEFEEEYEEVICYGISFYKKRCLVKKK